jgi:hypothetical protein
MSANFEPIRRGRFQEPRQDFKRGRDRTRSSSAKERTLQRKHARIRKEISR